MEKLTKQEKARERDWKRANYKRKVVSRFKRMKGCIECGYNKDHRALEFDHRFGIKKRTIASELYMSWDKIKKEIAKCVVICANCHAIRTHQKHKKFNADVVK